MKLKITTIPGIRIGDISDFLGLDDKKVIELLELGFLNTTAIRNKLILNDWHKLRSTTDFSKSAITEALAKKYNASTETIQAVAYNKLKSRLQVCISCGTEITNYKFKKNNGKCDSCVASDIINVIK